MVISFIPDPPERGPALSYDRILKFTTPNGSGYLSFIVRDGTVNISPFLCDSTVTVNTTDGPVPASILNSVPAGDDDPDELTPDEVETLAVTAAELWDPEDAGAGEALSPRQREVLARVHALYSPQVNGTWQEHHPATARQPEQEITMPVKDTGTADRQKADRDRLNEQRIALARTIADQAQAIADGTVTGPQWAAARRVLSNAETLMAWTDDDRA